jgi:hypothetical protein
MRFHLDEIDHPAEAALAPHRQLQHQRIGFEALDDGVHGGEEVRPDAIHLVDVADAGDAVAGGLVPDRLRLRLDPGDGVEDGHRPVEHPQGPLHLDSEIDMARGVDDVDPGVLPQAGGGGRGDRDAAFLLLGHPVHDGGALVDLAHLVGLARVVEDALGGGGLAGVDMRHDPDVPRAAQRVLAQSSKGNAGSHGSYQR